MRQDGQSPVSGTASAGDAHSMACRSNPIHSSAPRYRLAEGYRNGDEHLRQSQKMGVTWPFILHFVFCILVSHEQDKIPLFLCYFNFMHFR